MENFVFGNRDKLIEPAFYGIFDTRKSEAAQKVIDFLGYPTSHISLLAEILTERTKGLCCGET